MKALGSLLLAWAAAAVAPNAGRARQPDAEVRLGVGGVRVEVRDLPAAAAWLERFLGWKPAYQDDKTAVVPAGPVKIRLEAAPVDVPATIVLTSEDTDEQYRWLIDRGAVSLEAPADKPFGVRTAVLRGPGGLGIELDGPIRGPSELVFTELMPGTGETPRKSDTVTVHYIGKLPDGTVFADTRAKGRPMMVPLPSATPCWAQAVTRMKVHGKARFTCPPGLAYGKKGSPPRIPPDATLVFEVELLGIAR